MGYPTGSEVAARVAAKGYSAPGESVLESLVDAAVAALEAQTGYAPFLSNGEEDEWFLDPPEAWIGTAQDLGTAFISVSEVKIFASQDDGEGVVMTEGEDYHLAAYNGPSAMRIVDRIRWLRSPGRSARSVRVTGVRGAVEEVPADVAEAILELAACEGAQRATGLTGQFTEIAEGSVRLKLGGGLAAAVERARSGLAEAAARHRRVVI